MFNLIKNELIKIFSKKSVYVILAIYIVISIIGVTLTNVLVNTSSRNDYLSRSLEYEKENIKTVDTSTEIGKISYAESSAYIKYLELQLKYGDNSWQIYIIQNKLYNIITDIEYYKMGITDNIQNIGLTQEELQQEYDEIMQKLEKDDWRGFAEDELSNIKARIEGNETAIKSIASNNLIEEIKKENEKLQIEKEILEWRLEKNIPYNDEKYEQLLSRYNVSGQTLIEMNYEYGINQSNYLEKEEKEYKYNTKRTYQSYLSEYNINKYKIENNISENNSLEGIFEGTGLLFAIIIAISIAGTIISEEFNKGTIKMLLVRPYKRKKILLAKLIATLISLMIAIIIIIFADTIIYGIGFGFDKIAVPIVTYNYNTNTTISMNIYQYLGITILNVSPMLIILTMLALMIGTVLTNSSIAIVISLLAYMMSSIIESVALSYQKEWLKFIPTLNWNLSQYLYGALPLLETMSVGFSVSLCAIIILILGIVTFENFSRKNIKNI